MCIIKTAKTNEYISSDIVKVSTPLLISQLGEWVNRVISMLVSPLLTLPVLPDSILEDI